MDITIQKYTENDLASMIEIWNEVVEDGVAFPQEDFLNAESGRAFLLNRPILLLQRTIIPVRSMGFIFCIRTISDAVATSAMPVMP